ncbi:hypothetical protein BGZ46_001279, partial [Entomortierella lignicola]
RFCFTIGAEAYPDRNFYIDPKDVSVIGTYLLQRQFCLLLGHRQSGKTTSSQALLRWFQANPSMFKCVAGEDQKDFSIYMITFDSTVKLDDNFWTTVCEQFMALDKNRFYFDKTFPANGNTFKGFFAKSASAKRSILIIDEASRMTSIGDVSDTNKAITDEFINVIKSLRDDYSYNLHAVLLVGTESVREPLTVHNTAARTSQVSSFSSTAAFKTVRFTQSEVNELFGKFQERFSDFESAAIAADIFELTIGHKGLVGCCGVFIEKSYNIDNSPIKTIKEWKSKTADKLRTFISESAHYLSIIRSLEKLPKGCRDILSHVLRYGTHEVQSQLDATKYLLAEGMVSVREDTRDKNVVLECSAPILRSLMITSIASPAALRLSEDVPDDKRLDPRWLLVRTIESLNADNNPSEYAFQLEFSTILRHLIPLVYPTLKYKILVESKERSGLSDSRQRLDILVCNGGTIPAYGFELVVAASRAEYDEHCERAKQYGLINGCDMFMVNLCPQNALMNYFGGKQEDITPVNVVIDRDIDCGVIKYDGGVEEKVTIFGSQWEMMFL